MLYRNPPGTSLQNPCDRCQLQGKPTPPANNVACMQKKPIKTYMVTLSFQWFLVEPLCPKHVSFNFLPIFQNHCHTATIPQRCDTKRILLVGGGGALTPSTMMLQSPYKLQNLESRTAANYSKNPPWPLQKKSEKLRMRDKTWFLSLSRQSGAVRARSDIVCKAKGSQTQWFWDPNVVSKSSWHITAKSM